MWALSEGRRAGRAACVAVVALVAVPSAALSQALGAGEAHAVDPGVDAQPAPRLGGHCLDCPDYDFLITPLTGVWQFHSSSILADDCNTYAVDMDPRFQYTFSTCPLFGPGQADFEDLMTVSDSGCAILLQNWASCRDPFGFPINGTSVGIIVPPPGRAYLRISEYNHPPGSYTLAYIRWCNPDFSCDAPLAVIVPRQSCGLTAGTMTGCFDEAVFSADLAVGCTYTFSLCPDTCPGSGASFDARLVLDGPSGGVVAVDGAACGDGEIVYTVPLGGGGAYCILVSRETPGGGDTFVLSSRVECEPPSSLTVGPVAAVADDDCSRDQTFVADVVGVGPFTWAWSIASPAGGSASPASGTGASPGSHFEWNSLVHGAGVYQVEVTATNAGGSVIATIDYTLADDAPPQLVITADPADCAGPRPILGRVRSAPSFAPSRGSGRPVQVPLSAPLRSELEALMFSSPDVEEVALRVAQRMGVGAADVRVEDRLDAAPCALSCATPCTGDMTLSAASLFDEVSLTCDDAPEGLAWLGDAAAPLEGARDGRACVFDPADTPRERDSVGIEAEWTLTLRGGGQLPLREEIVLSGSTEQDAGMRLTLSSPALSRSVMIPAARARAVACAPAEVQVCPDDCVRLEATATDNCGAANVTFVGASPGAPPCNGNPCVVAFPDEGAFEYTWEAVDEAGNSVECSAIVTVERDASCNQAPTCDAGRQGAPSCREAPIEGASVDDADGDAIAWSWTSDNADVTLDPPSGVVAAGAGARALPPVLARLNASASACNASANLTLSIDDGRGGTSSCATSVRFHDDIAPEIAQGGAFTACLWPPNHWYACFTPEDLGLVVRDACSEPVTWSISRCDSDQPDDARERGWNGDGRTANDCVIESDGQTFCVRSERAGTGPTAQSGRHYTVAIVATDACGNVSNELPIAMIHVPHDHAPHDEGCIDVTHVGCRELPCSP
jgi:hypothetical protein